MEAIAALSLACNILQVAQYGCEAASTFSQVYKNNITDENHTIDTTTRHLSTALNQLEDSLRSQNNIDDAELLRLSQQCAEVAKSLNDLLTPFTQKPTRNRDKLRNGIKGLRLKGEVENLTAKLNKYQQTLDTKILIDLRSRFDITSLGHSKALSALGADLRAFIQQQIVLQRNEHGLTRAAVLQQGDTIAKKLEAIKVSQGNEAIYQRLLSSLRFAGMNARSNQIAVAHFKTFEWIFSETITNSREDDSRSDDDEEDDDEENDDYDDDESDDGILSVNDIVECAIRPVQVQAEDESDTTRNIPKAWKSSEVLDVKLLEQAYRCDNFVEWLAERNDNYWITGKPGSGKSTLMSYISNHELTLKHLRQWAPQQEVQIIDAYFWNPGSELQKSFKGMLATVLLQLIEKLDNTAREGFIGSLGNKPKFTIDDWSTGELERQVHALLTTSASKFCIFLDGLDEVKVAQSELDDVIVSFVDLVSQAEHVKCCISSRPWQIFEIAFQKYARLQLEYLNYQDIDQFFQDRLILSMQKLRVQLPGHEFADLRTEFNRKAEGVFLWAHLALNNILQGLRQRDAITDLHQRLEALPMELESLYEHMLSSSNKVLPLHRKEAAFFICIMLSLDDTEGGSLPLAQPNLLQFALCFEKYFSSSVDRGRESSVLVEACEVMRRRLLTRCAGLIEVRSAFGHDRANLYRDLPLVPALANQRNKQVRLIHRTVKEFLLSSPAGRRIWIDAAEEQAITIDMLIRAKVQEQSLSIRHATFRWLCELTYDIMSRRHLWTTDKVAGLLEVLDDSLASSATRHLGSNKRTYFRDLESHWTNFWGCLLRLRASLDLYGFLASEHGVSPVLNILSAQGKRVAPEYWMHLLHASSHWSPSSGSDENHTALTNFPFVKHIKPQFYACQHLNRGKDCAALRWSVADGVFWVVYAMLTSSGCTIEGAEALRALIRVSNTNTDLPSLVIVNIDSKTGDCEYTQLACLESSALERNNHWLTVIIKLKILHAISSYIELSKGISLGKVELDDESVSSMFDVIGLCKSRDISDVFPVKPFQRTSKVDSELIKAALLRDSPFRNLIFLGPSGLVVQPAGLEDLKNSFEPVFQRSEQVSLEDYMRQEGYMIDADDPRVLRDAPKMFIDDDDEVGEDTDIVNTGIVRRTTDGSWGVDEFYDAEM